MENSDDYAIGEATEYNGKPLVPGKWCAKCRTVKPLSLFKRYLTAAEAKSHGYAGRHKVEIETASCKSCTPKRTKSIDKMTMPEINAKVELGEIHALTARITQEQRRAAYAREVSAGGKKRWANARAKLWEPIIEQLSAEIQDVQMQRSYARANKHAAVAGYCTDYLDILKRVRSDLKLAKRRGVRDPEHKHWQLYLNDYEVNIVRAAWHDVSSVRRTGGIRPPGLFDREVGVSSQRAPQYYPKARDPDKPEVKVDWSDLTGRPDPNPENITISVPPEAKEDWSQIPWEDM